MFTKSWARVGTDIDSQLFRSQEDGTSNTETANNSVSASVSVSNARKSKTFANSRRRRAVRKAKSDLQDGCRSLAATLTQLAGRVDQSSVQARKVHSMAKLLLEDYQRDGKMISGMNVDMSDVRQFMIRLLGS